MLRSANFPHFDCNLKVKTIFNISNVKVKLFVIKKIGRTTPDPFSVLTIAIISYSQSANKVSKYHHEPL